MSNLEIAESEKFHFRGELPRIVDGSVTRLARRDVPGKSKSEIYSDIYCYIKDESSKRASSSAKSVPVLLCLLCRKTCKISYNTNATFDIANFLSHLKSQHPYELTISDQLKGGIPDEKLENLQPKLTSESFILPKQDTPADIKGKVADCIAQMIANHGSLPISLTEDSHFRGGVRAILGHFAPKVQINFPTRKPIRNRIMKITAESELKEAEMFRSIIDKREIKLFAITNDSTTSLSKIPFSCITCSLIEIPGNGNPWLFREHFLDCSPSLYQHTAENNAKRLSEVLINFMNVDKTTPLNDIISAGTFDCGSNTPAKVIQSWGITSIKCFDHRLNTLLEHINKSCVHYNLMFTHIYAVLERIRTSSINTNEMKRLQREAKLKELGCIGGAQTRWTYDTRSLRRAKRLWCTISSLDPDKLYFRNPAVKIEWKDNRALWARDGIQYLHYMLPVLERIEYWILFFESGRSVTISFCLYAIDDMKCFCSNMIEIVNQDKDNLQHQPAILPNQYTNIVEALTFINNRIDIIFDGFHGDSLLEVAELLDFRVAVPLQKRCNLRPGYYREPIKKFLNFFKDHPLAKKLFPVNQQLNDIQEADSPDQDNFNPFGFGVNSPNNIRNNDSNNDEIQQKFESEVRQYISEIWSDYKKNKKEDDRLNRDPLVLWWPKLEDKYPMLSKLALHILEISGSIAGSERFFSRLTNIISKKRCSLDKTLASRIILHSMRYRHTKLSYKKMKIPQFGTFIRQTVEINNEDIDENVNDDIDDDDVVDDVVDDDIDYNVEAIVFNDVNNDVNEMDNDQDTDNNARKRQRG